MCLAVFALDQHPRFSFVLAANRDEYLDRPAAPLDWWLPPDSPHPILAGRDLSAGGTWFGLSGSGRLALLTNVRAPLRHRPDAPSRGRIVTDWLTSGAPLAVAAETWQAGGYNDFNLVAADVRDGAWGWAGTLSPQPMALPAGLHGLSNARLDTPWPKVTLLREAMAQALRACTTVESLVDALFAALRSDARAADAALPCTGVPLELERALSAVFIRTDDARYGTRCSTVVIHERSGPLHVLERTHADDGGFLSWASCRRWPGGDRMPVQRCLQRGQGRATTLPSTFRKLSASS